MISERARGSLLCSLAALILVAGAVWWVRAAPDLGADARIAGWRATVERLLPQRSGQAGSGTVEMAPGAYRDVAATVPGGFYTVSVICAGPDGSRVRASLSTGGDDSGRGLPCTSDPSPVTFSLALSGALNLNLNVDEGGPVVFRWVLVRAQG